MRRLIALVFGIAACVAGVFAMAYTIAFVGDFLVPKTIDSGNTGSTTPALLVNTALLALFGVQHSAMARRSFKCLLTRSIPPAIERSTYVFSSSVALAIVYMLWRPLPDLVWHVEHPLGNGVLRVLFVIGWLLVFASIHSIDGRELLGIKQTLAHWRHQSVPELPFKTPLPYRLVRHPVYLGFLTAFWATPEMTLSHLMFAVGMTVYVLIAVSLEESDLVSAFGEQYRNYQASVPCLLPIRLKRLPATDPESPAPLDQAAEETQNDANDCCNHADGQCRPTRCDQSRTPVR